VKDKRANDDPQRKKAKNGSGVTRRRFIAAVGASAGAAATLRPTLGTSAPGELLEGASMKRITLHINGTPRELLVDCRWTLLRVLRLQLGLSAAKAGCERGECGSCTVLIDSKARYACLTLAVEAEGHEITTLEGLMDGERLSDLQRAFVEEDAFQCGYCTPGQIVAAEALLITTREPSREEIRQGMSGNLCRCGSYEHINRAVARCARERNTHEGASS